jgi:hypothetical protein
MGGLWAFTDRRRATWLAMRAHTSSWVSGAMILTLALSSPAGVAAQGPVAGAEQRSAPSSQPTPTIVEVSRGGGFDWGSAAIGGAAMLGLGVASIGCVLLVGQTHDERTGACDRPSRASRKSSLRRPPQATARQEEK